MKRNRTWWIESICGCVVLAALGSCAFAPEVAGVLPDKAQAVLAEQSHLLQWLFRAHERPTLKTDRVEAAPDG